MMNTMTIVWMCAFFLMATISLLSAFLIVTNRHKKELEHIKKYEINVNAAIDAKIPEILETFVKSVFDDYLVMHADILSKDYITQEEETAMIRELGNICSDRISPAMIDKLSLFWSNKSIASVIADKVYLMTVAYVASKNAVINESTKK